MEIKEFIIIIEGEKTDIGLFKNKFIRNKIFSLYNILFKEEKNASNKYIYNTINLLEWEGSVNFSDKWDDEEKIQRLIVITRIIGDINKWIEMAEEQYPELSFTAKQAKI